MLRSARFLGAIAPLAVITALALSACSSLDTDGLTGRQNGGGADANELEASPDASASDAPIEDAPVVVDAPANDSGADAPSDSASDGADAAVPAAPTVYGQSIAPPQYDAAVLDLPFGTLAGDFLLATIYSHSDSVPSAPPAGWTTLANQILCGTGYVGWFRKVAGPSEPATFSFGATGVKMTGVLIGIRGAHPSSPVDATSGPITANAPPYVAPILTTVSAPDLEIATFVNFGGAAGTWTTPAGMSPLIASGEIAAFSLASTAPGPTPAASTTPPASNCGAVNVFAFRGP